MEVRKPVIKSIPYDEFKDNTGLETIVDELHEGGVNVVVGSLDQAINWGFQLFVVINIRYIMLRH